MKTYDYLAKLKKVCDGLDRNFREARSVNAPSGTEKEISDRFGEACKRASIDLQIAQKAADAGITDDELLQLSSVFGINDKVVINELKAKVKALTDQLESANKELEDSRVAIKKLGEFKKAKKESRNK